MPPSPTGFILIDHPADLGIEAWGRTLAEAFEQAALGLISVILDVVNVEASESHEISLQGTDLEHLLVKWLAEILYLYDGQRFVCARFEIVELTSKELRAKILGEPFSEKTHTTRLDVKAITYHQLLVQEDGQGGRVRAFLDI